jgi:hypothetical protein
MISVHLLVFDNVNFSELRLNPSLHQLGVSSVAFQLKHKLIGRFRYRLEPKLLPELLRVLNRHEAGA